MKLKEFIQKYVAHSTLIRLWYVDEKGNYSLIHKVDESKVGGIDDVCMSWHLNTDLKIPEDKHKWQRKYAEANVIHVTDIVCDTYREAVNIVIDIKEGEL